MAATTERLAVHTRSATGTTAARATRREGRIPGVLFGHGSTPTPIEIDRKAFEILLHRGGKNHLLQLSIDGSGAETAIVRDLQHDPLSFRVIHADLQRVAAGEAIAATIPVVAVGVAEGVRSGGVLDVVTHELSISGPANAIPEHIEVDVHALAIRDHISAKDVVLPAGFKLLTPPDTIVVAVEPPRTGEVETAAVPAGEIPTVAETTADKA